MQLFLNSFLSIYCYLIFYIYANILYFLHFYGNNKESRSLLGKVRQNRRTLCNLRKRIGYKTVNRWGKRGTVKDQI